MVNEMNFNLNTSNIPDYDMNDFMIDEVIRMYGVNIKLLLTEKMNQDKNVFGDFSHMKTNSEDIFETWVMPEETEDFTTDGYSFSPFGMSGFDNVVLFISKMSLMPDRMGSDVFMEDEKVDFRKLMSQLIIFPNNKIMEISDVDPCVPSVNNLFTYDNAKSVYKLTCKPFVSNLVQELNNEDIAAPEVDEYDFSTEFGDPEGDDDDDSGLENSSFDELDKLFDQFEDESQDVDNEVRLLTDYSPDHVTERPEEESDTVSKSPIKGTASSIWGEFN